LDKDSQQLASLIAGTRADITHLGDKLISMMDKIMATLDDVVAKVKNEGDVIDSAVALINGFKDKLDAALASGADPEVLQKLSDDIGASTDKLAAAVAANTPTQAPDAAQAPAPSPAPEGGPVDNAAAPSPAPDQPAADPDSTDGSSNPPT
jgi:hypothetical protein